MTSAELVINTLKDLRGREEYNRYDENLCADIKKRLDGKLNEKNLGITEKTIFARNNTVVMDKWAKIFPAGITECLGEYFRAKASWAPKFDPRFPNQQQTKNCFINFVDYQRCMKLKGKDHKDCEYFKHASDALCPQQWLEKFNEQLEADAFPVDI